MARRKKTVASNRATKRKAKSGAKPSPTSRKSKPTKKARSRKRKVATETSAPRVKAKVVGKKAASRPGGMRLEDASTSVMSAAVPVDGKVKSQVRDLVHKTMERLTDQPFSDTSSLSVFNFTDRQLNEFPVAFNRESASNPDWNGATAVKIVFVNAVDTGAVQTVGTITDYFYALILRAAP